MPVADHIDNAVRSVTFNPVASVGPFALPWPIYEADSAAELKSDFLITLAGVVQTNFTVAGTFVDSVALDGAVTFGSGITGELIIYSRRKPRTSVDVSNGQAITSEELRAIINGLLASQRDIYDWLARVEGGTVLPAGFFVDKAGDTMSGFLTLNADPVNVLHAAPKQYIDGKLPATTKGDLIGHNGTIPVRVPVGANGKKLFADSTASSGLTWKRTGGIFTLTDAANISWDMDLGENFQVTLAGNRTLNAPSNIPDGRFGFFRVIQDLTGGRTLAWDATYKFPNSADEKPDPISGAQTVYLFYCGIGSPNVYIKKLFSTASNSIGSYKEYDKGALTVSTIYTQAHGLGRRPANIAIFLENTTTDAGWAVGDRLLVATGSINNSAVSACSVGENITNAYFAVSASQFRANNKSTGAAADLVTANWKVIMRVYE